MRRAVVTWLVVVALAVAAGAGAVIALNATVFGAAGFVRVYLEALGRGDAEGALTLPGVRAPSDLRSDFLVDDAMLGLTAFREVSVERRPDGTEVVTFAWRGPEGDGLSSFSVERTGSRFGLFPDWAFAESPIATLSLTVEHDERFSVNGIPAASGVAAAEPVGYAVLVPGAYRIDHTSTYLRADEVTVVADRPGSELAATLDVQPAAALVEQITTEVHEHLEDCAGQDVLFPTSCPLGHAFANRVVSTPEWSIVTLPELSVEPGTEFGTWLVPRAGVVAHLTVDVQSLFDGSVSTFDEDLPFDVSYLVTIQADDATLQIVAQYDD